MTEDQAKNILLLAIKNEQAAELLDNLFKGGSFTVDPLTRRLIMINQDLIEQALAASFPKKDDQ